jgi:hypothetical protein
MDPNPPLSLAAVSEPTSVGGKVLIAVTFSSAHEANRPRHLALAPADQCNKTSTV